MTLHKDIAVRLPFGRLLLLALVAACICMPARAATIYVAPYGDDQRSAAIAASSQTPLRTIGHALQLAQTGEKYGAGDTIVVRGGIYDEHLNLNKSGVTIRAYPGEHPMLSLTDKSQWGIVGIPDATRWDDTTKQGVYPPVHDVQIIGLTIDGAQAQPECSGIVIHASAHHVRIVNCTIGNAGAAGIAAVGTIAPNAHEKVSEGSDYLELVDNTIFRCAWGSKYDQSGITLLGLQDREPSDHGYHIELLGNRVYENQSRYTPPSFFGLAYHTDGNGIIIDTCFDGPKTLIANNIVYRNGGRGIHVFRSDNVDVVNNTCWKNCQDVDIRTPWPKGAGPSGELSAGEAARVRFINNIAVANGLPGARCASTFGASKAVHPTLGSVLFDSNLYFGGPSDFGSGPDLAANTHALTADPQFLAPDADWPDFRCRPSGPGVDTGKDFPILAIDVAGAPRRQGAAVDRGAYETHR